MDYNKLKKNTADMFRIFILSGLESGDRLESYKKTLMSCASRIFININEAISGKTINSIAELNASSDYNGSSKTGKDFGEVIKKIRKSAFIDIFSFKREMIMEMFTRRENEYSNY